MRGQKISRRNGVTGKWRCLLLLIEHCSFVTATFWGRTEECEYPGPRREHPGKSDALERVRLWRLSCIQDGYLLESVVTLTPGTSVRPKLEEVT